MNLLDLFEQQQHPAYKNLNALQQSVKNSQDAELDFGSGPVTVDYPLARYILSRYRAQQTGADRGQFLAALTDARRFDAIAKEYRQLADKAKLEEQYQGTPKAIGTAFLGLILKHQKDPMPVLIDFEDGQQAFRLTTPEVKDWFIRAFESYRRRGKESQFLEFMGTREGFGKLVSRFITDRAKLERERLGIGGQKKRPDTITEKESSVSARTQRMLDQLRVQHPYAVSDMEALAYSFVDAQKKDRDDINKLEKEIDDAEKSAKSDLKSALEKIKGRGEKAREKLGGVSAADERQDALLKKIVALDKEQSQAIDDLEKEIGSTPSSPSVQFSPTAAEPSNKSKQPDDKVTTTQKLSPTQFGSMTQQLSQPIQMKARKQSMSPTAVKARARRAAAKTLGTPVGDIQTMPGTITDPDTAKQLGKDIASRLTTDPQAQAAAGVPAPNVSDIQKARDRRDAARAAKSQKDLFGRGQEPRVVGLEESLRPGEWHEAEVTFDDGTKKIVRITSDEGFREPIIKHFEKQGKTVKDITVDYSVRGDFYEAKKKPTPTNPELWSRAKSAARSKFDVYPSAYANAWAAKWYKSKGGGWRMGKGAKK